MSNRGKSFIIVSSDNEKRETYKNTIIKSLNNTEIFLFNGSEFKKDDLERMMFSYNQRVNEHDNRVFIVEDYSKVSRLIQNKMLVTLESLPETKTFILLSNTMSGILPTILSRSVIIEDNHSSTYTRELSDEQIITLTNSINGGKLKEFDKVLTDTVKTLDDCKKIIIDLMSLSYEEKIKSIFLDDLVSIYEEVNLINSPNIVKIKLVNTFF